MLRNAGVVRNVLRRSYAAEAAVAADNKLKLNFFLPHDAIKKDVSVVRLLFLSSPMHSAQPFRAWDVCETLCVDAGVLTHRLL